MSWEKLADTAHQSHQRLSGPPESGSADTGTQHGGAAVLRGRKDHSEMSNVFILSTPGCGASFGRMQTHIGMGSSSRLHGLGWPAIDADTQS